MKRILTCVIAIAALMAMVACGGGGSSSTGTGGGSGSSSSPVTINVGDATSDRLLSFEVTVSSVTLTGANGTANTANLLPAATKVELTHLSGKFEPLRLMGIPQGSYSGATIQFGSAEAVIVGAAGTGQAGQIVKVQNIVANPGSVSVTFPTLTVGATASVLNFDFNLGSSVTVNSNLVTFTPSPTSITVVTAQAGQVEDEQENETGEIEDIHGSVTALGTNTFTIALENNSQTLTFTVGDATQTSFSDGLTAFADLKVGMVVKVEGVTKPDGTLFAKEVEGTEIQNGLEAEGIITNTALTNGVGTISVVVHESASAAAATSQPQTNDTITINIGANTTFRADFGHGKTKINDPGLLFDGTHLGMGQKVEADDDTSRVNNLQARKLKLKKQALVGTASNVSANGFTLTLDAANSFFTQLTGESVIQVVTSSKTLTKGAAPANGQSIRVRGLLFFDPAKPAGQKYTLAAGRTDH